MKETLFGITSETPKEAAILSGEEFRRILMKYCGFDKMVISQTDNAVTLETGDPEEINRAKRLVNYLLKKDEELYSAFEVPTIT